MLFATLERGGGYSRWRASRNDSTVNLAIEKNKLEHQALGSGLPRGSIRFGASLCPCTEGVIFEATATSLAWTHLLVCSGILLAQH